jgi:hypothetical protein
MKKLPKFQIHPDWVRETMRSEKMDTLAIAERCNAFIKRRHLKFRPVIEADVWNLLAQPEEQALQEAA